MKKGIKRMHEDFIRDRELKEKNEDELDVELIKSIIKTKRELANSGKNFEFAEGELIDYYLYQMKASQAKLNYLLGKAKRNGLIIDMIKEIEIRREEYNEQFDVG